MKAAAPLALAFVLAALAPPAAAQTGGAVRTPALPDTAHVSEVEGEDGAAVLRATGQPFTGVVVDAYPSGAKKLRRSVVGGRAEGLWVEWYESGVPRYLAAWRDGKGDGVWTYFHETGEVRERATVVADVYDGPVEGWHANGRKAFEGAYLGNAKDGTFRYWDEAGRLDRTEVYRRGERVE